MTDDRRCPTRYVLVHGAGGSPWEWHLVASRLEGLGHEVVAVQLPCDDQDAGLEASAQVIAAAIDGPAGAGTEGVVVVAQSFAGVTAPLACHGRHDVVTLLVLLCAMVPAPGERAADWWEAVGMADAQASMAVVDGRVLPEDDAELVTDDIPAALRPEADRRRRLQVATPVFEPWPAETWPAVPTAVVIGARDRFFPAPMQRRVAAARLGLVPHELDAGHVPALSAPDALVSLLERLRVDGGHPVTLPSG